jgi:hypothetical protein
VSAFVVSKADIDILVTAIVRLRPAGRRMIDLSELGRLLWRENVKSMAYRYGMPERHADEHAGYLEEIAAYRFRPTVVCRAAVAKVAACYDYQACEHPGWEASEAHEIYALIAEAYPTTSPNYDAMPWGISGAEDLAKARGRKAKP